MFFWIYDYPTWQMATLFVLAFVSFGVGGLLVFRRFAHPWLHRDEHANEMVGFAMSSFAMLYSLLLGLLAVAAYGSFSAAGDSVTREASSLAALYRDVGGLPAPVGAGLQQTLRTYTREVIDVSWPLQREGVIPTRASHIVTLLFAQLHGFKPVDLGQQSIHAEAMRQANTLVELRRMRLANVNSGIPNILWTVVLLGALINIVLIWMMNVARHVHVLMTGLLAAFMGLVIFLVAAMDYPFRGEVSVGAEAFEQVYQTLMAPRVVPG